MKKIILTTIAFFGLASITMAQVPAYVPTLGLQGWWPFNGNANDESGNANHGVVTGAVLTLDRFGNANKAYKFDGINDKIVANRPQQTSFSASVWQKIDTLCSYTPCLDAYLNNWELMSDGAGQLLNIVVFSNPTAALYTEYPQNYTLTTNNWNHFVVVYSNSIWKVYVNSALLATFSTTPVQSSPGSYYMGNSASGSDQWLNGKLDDIGVWNRALTECEIKQLYYTPAFSVTASNTSVCSGASATLLASGVPNYSWSSGATTASAVVNPVSTSIYTVTSTYSIGCKESKTVAISVVPGPSITPTSSLVCRGGSATLTASGATNYTWSTNVNTPIVVVSPSTTTVYTVSGNSGGCISSKTIQVSVSACTGIANLEGMPRLTIQPNPAIAHLGLNSTSQLFGQKFAIYDGLGALVFENIITQSITTIQVEDWPRGLYILRIDEAGLSYKIIKE
jgi:hypothetical protein